MGLRDNLDEVVGGAGNKEEGLGRGDEVLVRTRGGVRDNG